MMGNLKPFSSVTTLISSFAIQRKVSPPPTSAQLLLLVQTIALCLFGKQNPPDLSSLQKTSSNAKFSTSAGALTEACDNPAYFLQVSGRFGPLRCFIRRDASGIQIQRSGARGYRLGGRPTTLSRKVQFHPATYTRRLFARIDAANDSNFNATQRSHSLPLTGKGQRAGGEEKAGRAHVYHVGQRAPRSINVIWRFSYRAAISVQRDRVKESATFYCCACRVVKSN